MSKSIKKNYAYNLIYQVLTLLFPLVTTPYLSRILGADGVGLFSYAESIISYFVLFAGMGIAIYGQREVSYNQDSEENRSKIFWETQLLKLITTGVCVIIYIAFILFVVEESNKILYTILIFQLLSVAVDAVWFFQGMEEFGKIVFRNILVRIALIVFIFVFVKEKDDLIYYALGHVGIYFLSALSIWGYLPKYVKRVKLKFLRPFRNFKVVWLLFVPTIAIQIYTVLDKTMIGLITQNSFENGYYEQALKISKMTLAVVSALTTVMIPRIGRHFEKKEDELVKMWMYKSYRFVWCFAIPICIGLVMVANKLIPWFLGDGYDAVVPILQVSALLVVAIGINTVTGNQYLIPTKREKLYTKTVLFGAGVNFCLNIVFISMWGAIGAAIASVIAETAIAVTQILLVRSELKISTILLSSVKYLIAGVIMGAALYVEGLFLQANVIDTIIMIGSGVVIYFLSLLVMRDQFTFGIFKKVILKLKRKSISEEQK